MSDTFDHIYSRAAAVTGKTQKELRLMAQTVFAVMLHHSLEQRGTTIWTASSIQGGKLDVEVNIPPRKRIQSESRQTPKTNTKTP